MSFRLLSIWQRHCTLRPRTASVGRLSTSRDVSSLKRHLDVVERPGYRGTPRRTRKTQVHVCYLRRSSRGFSVPRLALVPHSIHKPRAASYDLELADSPRRPFRRPFWAKVAPISRVHAASAYETSRPDYLRACRSAIKASISHRTNSSSILLNIVVSGPIKEMKYRFAGFSLRYVACTISMPVCLRAFYCEYISMVSPQMYSFPVPQQSCA